jgi:hypothetical protein
MEDYELTPVFIVLQLYLHNYEALCAFLKPFVEAYLGQQIQSDVDEKHTQILKHFLRWVNPELHTILTQVMDKKLRKSIAHASYMVTPKGENITARDMQSRKIRTYLFSEVFDLFEDLFTLNYWFRMTFAS